jgi:hypothetical protein
LSLYASDSSWSLASSPTKASGRPSGAVTCRHVCRAQQSDQHTFNMMQHVGESPVRLAPSRHADSNCKRLSSLQVIYFFDN